MPRVYKSFDQLLEQDIKREIDIDVIGDEDNNLIDSFITQTDIDKANELPDEIEDED
ncbi:MAG: hypothetical protein M0P49_06180 [Bacilli bacterium]|nr:hypothetical protein [Bacilli bacterium]